ncbi:hypothetical protein K438DRAFT_1963154 [Mycena galopus ATCC 62051]|nr:hypothetical protein K438DRAFT_1963154 [Mycena galopus ATCC 62051]
MESPSEPEIEAFIGTPFDYIIVGMSSSYCRDPILPLNLPQVEGPQAYQLRIDSPKIQISKLGSSKLDRGSWEKYDAWASFSDTTGGWNWDSLLPFLTKTQDQEADPSNRDLMMDRSASDTDIVSPSIPSEISGGRGGPVKTCYNMWNTDLIPPYVKAWNTLGHSTNSNPLGGDANGLYNCQVSVDYQAGKRITATSAYYAPASSRKNLKLLTGAQVTKILFNSESANSVAVGVEFTANGETYSVSASREIIISAGAIGTPHILELSGIGDPKRLENIGIRSVATFQDHPFTHIHYQTKEGIRTFDELGKNPEFAAAEQERYAKTGQGWMASNDSVVIFTSLNKITEDNILSARIKEFEAGMALKKSQGLLNKLAMRQYSIQLDWLKEGRLPHLEFILFSMGLVKPDPDASYFMMTAGLQHPFSRGSVHIQSADPLQQPSIDPGYLTDDFDMFSLLADYRAIEKLAETPPWADIIAKQVLPATQLTDEEVIQFEDSFIRSWLRPTTNPATQICSSKLFPLAANTLQSD